MRAPLKKILIARYVLLLEIIGFVIMGLIIGGMIFCVIYKIDDTCKVKTDAVSGRVEPIALPAKAYMRSVKVHDGQDVKQGDVLFSVLGSPDDVKVMEVRECLTKASASLSTPTVSTSGAPAVADAVAKALEVSKQMNPAGPVTDIVAPIAGTVKVPDAATLLDSLRDGKIASVVSFDSLRFTVGVGGKNADRVNISLLGPLDVLDWSAVTKALRSDAPPSDPLQAYVWEVTTKDETFKSRLKFVQPGKTPTDEGKGDVIAVLNGLLRKKDFYNEKVWNPSTLGNEAKQLIAKGVASLSENELYRLNRLLLQDVYPEWIAKSPNVILKIKTKFVIPQESKIVNGQEQKQKPIIYDNVDGTVLTDRDVMGTVTVDLPSPPKGLREYLEKRLQDPKLPAAAMNGDIVVGKIALFRFLFSK